MSQGDAEQKCMICRAIGFVIAAVVVGLISWWLFGKVAAWLAILGFLALFALGLWLVLQFCGQPEVAAGHAAGTGSMAPSADEGARAATAVQVEEDAQAAAAKAESDAKAAAARAEAQAKADADAKAAAAKADADAKAAAAKADANAKAAAAKADSEAARAAAEAEAARRAAEDAASTAAAASQAEQTPDYDGDGVREGSEEGTRPAGLDAPRDGNADNLKEIKGVGPKMEKLCNSLGFWHFDQIAAWTADEVAWVDANLEGFKGRVTRDDWVAQAKILAAGGETEFSKRVEDGDVY